MPSTGILDHIVYLAPTSKLQLAIDQFQQIGFRVLPGGTHADGLTSNALVVLSDGVYFEIIAFTQPAEHYPPGSSQRHERESHWWASKAPGWIDWANLGTDEIGLPDAINRSANSSATAPVSYLPPIRGGRVKPDGESLEWLVTFPDPVQHGRGCLPFFCQDLTPRLRRVPVEGENTRHISSAIGISHILLTTRTEADLALVAKQLSSVLDREPTISQAMATWDLESPNPINDDNKRIVQLMLSLDPLMAQGQDAVKTAIAEVGIYSSDETATDQLIELELGGRLRLWAGRKDS